jgi:hypothetical protein
MTHIIQGNEDFLSRPLSQLGVPPLDIISARRGMEMIHFEFTGDLHEVMG